jgi:hypothetical protein
MSSAFRPILSALAVIAALSWADRPSSALPPILFSGGRPPKTNERPPIPLPETGPLPSAKADSIITAQSTGKKYPETRYDIFDVDLDGDGKPEQIAQVVIISMAGWFTQCWWGVYAGGKLDQAVYWNYPEQRDLISTLTLPESFRDSADSLGFQQSIPEFFPAADIVKYGDLTGDGKPEYILWTIGRAVTPRRGTGVVCPIVLSPTPEGLKAIFRTNTVFVNCTAFGKGERSYTANCYRFHTRSRKTGGALDLLLEKVASPTRPDSMCNIVALDERLLPHDPDEWMPLKPMAATAAIPKDWMIAQWDGTAYRGLRFVRDVKLD